MSKEKEIKKGVIYKLTSPDGKSWIGQSDSFVERRFGRHINYKEYCEKTGKAGCSELYKAFDKFGHQNFKKETIIECDLSELDQLEIDNIIKHNTLYPNGYNLTTGGRKGFRLCEYSIQKKKINIESKDMPSYTTVAHDSKKGTIVLIQNHPLCKYKVFADQSLSVEENKERATKFLAELEKENKTYVPVEKKMKDELPPGVTLIKNGYRVRITIGDQLYEKSFRGKSLDDDTKKLNAIKWAKLIRESKPEDLPKSSLKTKRPPKKGNDLPKGVTVYKDGFRAFRKPKASNSNKSKIFTSKTCNGETNLNILKQKAIDFTQYVSDSE